MSAEPVVKRRIVYLAHSLRSDWNNGNAHFLRGLMRALVSMGHDVTVLEPETEWSIVNLASESRGADSLAQFSRTYPELRIETYGSEEDSGLWRQRLAEAEVVILHEWNPPDLARRLIALRDELGFKMLFHDTHHRASSSPEQMERFGLQRFDGIVAFGEALRTVYRERFGVERVWTLHEAADTTVFRPQPATEPEANAVWIGNWGEGERSAEIREFFLRPAELLRSQAHFQIYGVRYPEEGLKALEEAGVRYGGYLPNLDAPRVYAGARLTVHIPRQQYAAAMTGIPTIRVFEALACGIPLISAPWRDTEALFRAGDFQFVADGNAMAAAMRRLLHEPEMASEQARRGLETVLARHTCGHRARELTAICEELLH